MGGLKCRIVCGPASLCDIAARMPRGRPAFAPWSEAFDECPLTLKESGRLLSVQQRQPPSRRVGRRPECPSSRAPRTSDACMCRLHLSSRLVGKNALARTSAAEHVASKFQKARQARSRYPSTTDFSRARCQVCARPLCMADLAMSWHAMRCHGTLPGCG